jgi:hypothetical protein
MTHPSIYKTFLMIFIALAFASAPVGDALAKKGGNGQTGNGGGGGGNDSPDPEYAIQADMVEEGCYAYNPDLKGPGVALGGFYDYIGASPYTCADITLGTDTVYLRALGVESDESGVIHAFWLRGRDADSILYESAEIPIGPIQAPVNDPYFQITVDLNVPMNKCTKVRGKTTCVEVGSVYVGVLDYLKLGN